MLLSTLIIVGLALLTIDLMAPNTAARLPECAKLGWVTFVTGLIVWVVQD